MQHKPLVVLSFRKSARTWSNNVCSQLLGSWPERFFAVHDLSVVICQADHDWVRALLQLLNCERVVKLPA